MKRKLISQGKGGYTITLPVDWIRKHNLNPGSELEVGEQDDQVLVSTSSGNRKKEISVIIDFNNPSRLRTLLASLYRRGYDKIILTSKAQLPLKEINEVVDSLIGYVILEQGQKQVIIKDVMEDHFEEVGSIVNKMFLMVKNFQNEVLNNSIKHEDLLLLKKSLLKHRDYCQRMILINHFEGERAPEYYELVYILDKIAANYHDLSTLSKIKTLASETKLQMDLFSSIYSTYLKKEIDTALRLNQEISQLRKKLLFSAKHPLLLVMIENLFTLSSRIVGVCTQ